MRVFWFGRWVFFSVLFVLFLYLFGYSSVTTYLAKGVTIEVSTEQHHDGNVFPALTLCGIDKTSGSGWKNGKPGKPVRVQNACNGKTVEQVEDCIDEETYSLEEILVFFQPLDHPVMWKSDITSQEFGKCHTLHYPFAVGTNPSKGSVSFFLNSTLKYIVFIHDPDYFLPTGNPMAVPHVKLEFEGN